MYHGIKTEDRAKQHGFLASLPTTRAAAVLAGSRYFFTGVPCRQGHVTYRLTNSWKCADCMSLNNARKQDPEYTKKWRKTESGAASIKAGKKKAAARDPKWNWAINKVVALRKRAEKTGVAFDLTSQDLYAAAVDKCPVFGTELVYYGVRAGGEVDMKNVVSVDRVRATGGYTKDNIAIISMAANTMKSNGSVHDVELLLRWMKANCIEQGNDHGAQTHRSK